MNPNLSYTACEYVSETNQRRDFELAQEYAFTHDVDASCFQFTYQGKLMVAIISERQSDLNGFPVMRGIPATLDSTTMTYLGRRKSAANKLGPWAEGHYRA